MELLVMAVLAQPYPSWSKAHNDLENTGYTDATGMLSSVVKKWEYITGADVWPSSPAVMDAEGDGTQEVYFGSEDGFAYCVNGLDGSFKWSSATGNSGWSSPAVADLDADGTLDVAIGGTARRMFCFDGSTGATRWVFTAPAGNNFEWSTPTIADVDKDGDLEVLVISSAGTLYFLNGNNGTVQRSYTGSSAYYTSPAVADLDNDGSLEVVVGSGNSILCVDSAAGFLWSYNTGGTVRSAPAIADLDGDGLGEVVCGSNNGTVFCLEDDGSLKWSYATGGAHEPTPAIADLDADSQLEVVVSGRSGVLRSLNGLTGAVEWAYTMTSAGGGPLSHQPVAIADIDGDGVLEVACVAQMDSIYVVNGATGAFEWAWGGDIYWSPGPVIADVDGDSCVEMIYGGDDNRIHVLDDPGNGSGCGPVGVGDSENKSAAPLILTLRTLAGGLLVRADADAEVALYDPCGRLVTSFRLEGGAERTVVGLPSGVYLVRASDGTSAVSAAAAVVR